MENICEGMRSRKARAQRNLARHKEPINKFYFPAGVPLKLASLKSGFVARDNGSVLMHFTRQITQGNIEFPIPNISGIGSFMPFFIPW